MTLTLQCGLCLNGFPDDKLIILAVRVDSRNYGEKPRSRIVTTNACRDCQAEAVKLREELRLSWKPNEKRSMHRHSVKELREQCPGIKRRYRIGRLKGVT